MSPTSQYCGGDGGGSDGRRRHGRGGGADRGFFEHDDVASHALEGLRVVDRDGAHAGRGRDA